MHKKQDRAHRKLVPLSCAGREDAFVRLPGGIRYSILKDLEPTRSSEKRKRRCPNINIPMYSDVYYINPHDVFVSGNIYIYIYKKIYIVAPISVLGLNFCTEELKSVVESLSCMS